MSDNNDVTAVVLVATQAVTLWTVMCPPITDVRRHSPGSAPEFTRDVRHTELIAGTLTISVAAVMSLTTGNIKPLIASGALVACLLVAYEYSLRQPGAAANLTSMEGTA